MKKHIVCFGDSNTHGFCADPTDCADGGDRFNENERWTCLLGKALGQDEYLVLEEGMSGRTTVFQDPLHEGVSGLEVLYPILMTHEPVDLLIIMLGTNDTKQRFGVNAASIAVCMERLVEKAKATPAWRDGKPNILVIAPPHMREEMYQNPGAAPMGPGCPEKSRQLAYYYAQMCQRQGCHFLDAQSVAEFNRVDHVHLTRQGHANLAKHLAQLVPALL